ncbi:MAG: hypothetical protein JWO82_3611 [Akkermansiaceae bacterium]|nr:hypothetical protein [Akkermansiaceae bacterium]
MFRVLVACLGFVVSASAVEDVPRGSLAVDRDMIQVATKSQLTWNISYPSPVTSVVKVLPPNIICPTTDLRMKVKVLGASFQATITQFLPVQVKWSKNSSTWTDIFYGLQTTILPSTVVLDTLVKKDDKINFGGRGYRDNAWLPLYTTAMNTPNLVMLANGDRVPTTTPAFQQGSIESFLKPYLNAKTGLVSIGDRDLIILMELGQTNPTNSGFDLQDLVLKVTFEDP